MTIQVPTTLVVGAGASLSYGLPTGSELLRRACGLTSQSEVFQLAIDVLRGHSIKAQQLNQFLDELRAHPEDSIDAFLEKRQHRPEVVRIGKTVITALVGHSILNPRRPRANEDWLQYTVQKMLSGADTLASFVEGNAPVKFVTFNFDTFIESDLRQLLVSSYGGNVQPALDRCPVLHVHGSFTQAPPDIKIEDLDQRARFHGLHQPWVEWIDDAADRISVTSDAISKDVLDLACEVVRGASVVCFLGFGYNLRNIEKLGFPDDTGPSSQVREVFGSAYGMTGGDRATVMRRLGSIKLGDQDTNCLGLLKDRPVLQER